MANTPLETLAAYVTPTTTQIQQTQVTEQINEGENTPGQKRKRSDKETHQESRDNPQSIPKSPAQYPNHTPSPSGPIPNYALPQFNKTRSPPIQKSPTSEALKRRKVQNQNKDRQEDVPSETQRDQAQEMLVDEEDTTPTDQRNTPRPTNSAHGRNTPPQTPSNQNHNTFEESITQQRLAETIVEVDEYENAKTLARIMATSERNYNADTQKNPLAKYTQGPMPNIFDGEPATLLAGIDKEQIRTWLIIPTGKVLARPFDISVNRQTNHPGIAMALLAAAKEITGAASAAVASPNRDRNAPRQERPLLPRTFLIHDLTKDEATTLLEGGIWSSKDITFQVAPVNVKRPDFLFTIAEFATDNEEHVADAIMAAWNDQMTNAILRSIAGRTPDEEEQQERMGQMLEFLESMMVTRLDMRKTGKRPDPHFNVYTNGEAIEDEETWLDLRRYLRNRPYKSNTLGTGRVKTKDFTCSLCHGHDHPRGLCPFPSIPGWNGGNRNIPRTFPNADAGSGDRTTNGHRYRDNHTTNIQTNTHRNFPKRSHS